VAANHLRHPALLERDRELDLLRASTEAARRGQGAVLLIEAPAGLGKTGLLQVAADLAGARSLRVLPARGGELERDLAYGLVRQLFERMLADAAGPEREALLDGPAGLASGLMGLSPLPAYAVPDRVSSDDPTGAVLHGLYWLAANAAGLSPVALLVDDLHWADPASLRYVVYLARRLETLPILLVAATRPADDPAVTELMDALKRAPATTTVTPAPLTAGAVEALVRQLFDGSADEAFCRACHTVTGGNPFLLRELLGALRDDGASTDAAAVRRVTQLVPAALADTIVVRLGRLPTGATGLAQAVAVLGTDVAARHAYALAGLARPDGAAATDALTRAGILRPGQPLEFTHPLVRAAVHEAIPAAQRALLHHRAADLMYADDEDPQRIAPHLLAGEPNADPRTVATLRQAATVAVGRGAPETAVRYLRRALAEPPQPPDRPMVLAELGKAEVRAAEPDAAVAHLRAALAATAEPRARAEMAHDLAIGLIAPGHYREAVEMLAATAAAARAVDAEAGLRLEAELLCAARLDPSTLPLVVERVDRLPGPPAGRTPGERMLLATLAHWRMIRGGRAAEVHDLVTRAVDGGLLAEQPGDSGVVIDALVTLTVIEDFARADAAFAQAFADVRARNSVIGFARLSCMRSLLEYRRGALAEAEGDARSAVEVGMAPGYRVGRMAHAPLLDALIVQGRPDEAESALSAAGLDGEIRDTYMLNYVLASRGRLRLAQGRPADAVADLTELDRRERKWRAPNPGVLGYGVDLALAHYGVGDVATATDVGERTLAAARTCGIPAATGAALRTLGLIRGDLDLLAESVAGLESSPARLELARSLVEFGAAVRRSGQRTAAREPLHRGMELAHRCGAAPLADRARSELISTGSRPRRIPRTGVDALTAGERRVARLAADGMTNREIAQALFVTVRTVQVHLQHAYQKLGVESRADLRGALDAEV
jgi:DNA-binding CsgD family transcriptional regulator